MADAAAAADAGVVGAALADESAADLTWSRAAFSGVSFSAMLGLGLGLEITQLST